jgi:hypothetical protein
MIAEAMGKLQHVAEATTNPPPPTPTHTHCCVVKKVDVLLQLVFALKCTVPVAGIFNTLNI